MKKLIALGLMMLLLFSTFVTFGEGEYSTLDSKIYYIYEDNIEDQTFILPKTRIEKQKTPNGFSLWIPYAQVFEDSLEFGIIVEYQSKDWCFIEEVIIKVGDTRYFFYFEYDEIKTDVHRGITESTTLKYSDMMLLLIDIAEDPTQEVVVRYKGSESNQDFILNKYAKEQLADFYNNLNNYKEATNISFQDSSLVEGRFLMEFISIKKTKK